MTAQIVGIACRVDTGENGRMRLPGARIRLCDPRPCGADVEIIAARLLDQALSVGLPKPRYQSLAGQAA